jgi:CBS domain-containing protein
MKVSEVMTRQVELAKPDETIQQAAGVMAQIDSGALPVTDGDRLIGMLTDRDIAIRAVAKGKGPDAKVRDVMTPEVKYCFEDEDLGHVAKNMGEIQVRRLPVMSRDKRLVGIVSLGDIAFEAGKGPSGKALEGVSQPGGQHNQSEMHRAAGSKPGMKS